ncbi:MAG: hypothetical protein AB7K24_21615, partial [Gemmataceae bacterium]
MVLRFPSPELLRQVLAEASLPIGMQPARAGSDRQGNIWIEPAEPLGRAALKKLQKLGVDVREDGAARLNENIHCWHALVPIERRPQGVPHEGDFLFEVSGDRLPAVIAEMRRLGCQHCGLRWLEEGMALLRVAGPPYLSVLRAGETDCHDFHAYRQESPGLWVEIGHVHPLAAVLPVPSGQLVLIRAPRRCRILDDEPFDDLGNRDALPIPASDAGWNDAAIDTRLSMPLRLARSGVADAAELWVLEADGRRQLQQLIEQIDDRLAAQLAVATAERAGHELLVLRQQAKRTLAPLFVLDGLACCSYLKLPHLFIPCGMRLQPVPRRDLVRKLFPSEDDRITWLRPDGAGRFVPESLATRAFRPLEEWIEYQRQGTVSLSPLGYSAAFELPVFSVAEEAAARRPPPERPKRQKVRLDQVEVETEVEVTPVVAPPVAPVVMEVQSESAPGDLHVERFSNEELTRRLAEIQQAFIELQFPLDAPERQGLWREMATLNAVLGHSGDSALAWAYAIWDIAEVPAEQAEAWLRSAPPLDAGQLDADPPEAATLLTLVAYLVHGAHAQHPPDAAQLRLWQRVLEKHEAALPVRLAWLAHSALFKLTGGDALTLARARDRILERLFQHGLRVELDLPTFLRFSGKIGQDRLVAVREHLLRLHKLVRTWLGKHPRAPFTRHYADLCFAYGLARLGATVDCEKLLQTAAKIKNEDELHGWLVDAYTQRIRQALRGEPRGQPLPGPLVERLDSMTAQGGMARYKGDRIRRYSRILEPHEKIDPIARRYAEHFSEEIDRELNALSALTDGAELWPRLGGVLEDKKRAYRPYRGVILARALELAPRVGEEFARHVLGRVVPALADLADAADVQVQILEKGIFLAAHYDQGPYLLSFVERFEQILAAGTAQIQKLEPLLGQLFLGLRKFGMRDLVGQLLERVTGLILAGHNLKQLRQLLARQAGQGLLKRSDAGAQLLATWQALLHVAEGWLYFGQEEQ